MASYTYNGDGRRTRKVVNEVTTEYTWDALGLGVVLGDGSEYVWGLGLIGQVTGGGTATYAHADGLGSIRVLTDGAGSSVGTQAYDAFGGTRSQSGVQVPFSYTGEQVDPESGLVYLRARYMDPATGRFLTKDPFPGSLMRTQSLQRYSYVRNSPIRLVDPSGLTDERGSVGPIGSGGGGGGGVDPIKPVEPVPPVPEVEGPILGPELPLFEGPLAAYNRFLVDGKLDAWIEILNEDHLWKIEMDELWASGQCNVRWTPGQHLREVTEAYSGLTTRIKDLQRALGDSRLTAEQSAALQQALTEALELQRQAQELFDSLGP